MILPKTRKGTKTAVAVGISTMLFLSNTAMAASLIRVGSRGNDVTEVQQVLKNKGYYTMKVDGIFGNGTRLAVIAFQRAAGITADGVVGPVTYSALNGSAASKPDTGSQPAEDTVSQPKEDPTPTRGSDSSGTSLRISHMLRAGSRGSEVTALQQALKSKGYYTMKVDGVFGNGTRQAVIAFQRAAGITADGIVGPMTVSKLNSDSTVSRGGDSADRPVPQQPETPTDTTTKPDTNQGEQAQGKIEMLDWSVVDKLYPRKSSNASFVDVLTGKRVHIHRYGGTLHADIEPLTKEDTATLKEIYGGSWSWTRRAVIFELDGKRIAASINGMPHGGQDIPYSVNNFNGQFCMHFLNSRVHESGKIDPDHQAMVRFAAASEN